MFSVNVDNCIKWLKFLKAANPFYKHIQLSTTEEEIKLKDAIDKEMKYICEANVEIANEQSFFLMRVMWTDNF